MAVAKCRMRLCPLTHGAPDQSSFQMREVAALVKSVRSEVGAAVYHQGLPRVCIEGLNLCTNIKSH